jgi:hypothetical protein
LFCENKNEFKKNSLICVSGDNANVSSKTNHRGETALLVGVIVLFFAMFTIGIAILISRKRKQGNEENEYHSLMTK